MTEPGLEARGTDNGKLAICFSGGGFRATLFHLGSLWRLFDAGLLGKVQAFSGVSGGTIAQAVLGLAWQELFKDNPKGSPEAWRGLVVDPLFNFCGRDIQSPSIWQRVFTFASETRTGSVLVREFERLFRTIHGKQADGYTLNDLPHGPGDPAFYFCATSLQTGSTVSISPACLFDPQVGWVEKPDLPLAKVLQASTAFPPIFAPVVFNLPPAKWEYRENQWQGVPAQCPAAYGARHVASDPFGPAQWEKPALFARSDFRERIYLVDGGVSDNLGMEPVIHNPQYQTVLVSDAGLPHVPLPRPRTNGLMQAIQSFNIIYFYSQHLRKKLFLDHVGEENGSSRRGSYWGVSTKIASFGLSDSLVEDKDETERLSALPTSFHGPWAYPEQRRGQLINWGYALCDAALRSQIDPSLPRPSEWPCPEWPL